MRTRNLTSGPVWRVYLGIGRGTGPISWVQFVMATGAKNEPRGFTVVSEAALG
jgi:hypothetical protein